MRETQSQKVLRRKERSEELLGRLVPAVLVMLTSASAAQALGLKEAIIFVLESHPEISAAEFNKQAIEFELDQARSLRAPRIDLSASVMSSINEGTTSIDLSAADDALEGYEFTARLSQTLFDGFETRSEIERQAYRVDAAALRVLERSEFLGLEAARVISDMRRAQTVLDLGRQNLAYHQEVVGRVEQAYAEEVVGIADLQQARERVFLARDILVDLELDLEDSRTFFIEIVGMPPENLEPLPAVRSRLPSGIDTAMAEARRNNPTVRFLQMDVGAAEALQRSVASNRYPDIALEAEARLGEDINSFEGDVNEARVGVVARYVFQGSQNRANRQEHVRRVSEARSQLLAQARIVDREVRQSWSTLQNARRRVQLIQQQVQLAADLRSSYETEFEIGNRTLLDVLNTQASLFEAQADLVSARSLEVYSEYRLLAASGRLLATLGIVPPEDAIVYATAAQNAPPVGAADTQEQFDARAYRDWRAGVGR